MTDNRPIIKAKPKTTIERVKLAMWFIDKIGNLSLAQDAFNRAINALSNEDDEETQEDDDKTKFLEYIECMTCGASKKRNSEPNCTRCAEKQNPRKKEQCINCRAPLMKQDGVGGLCLKCKPMSERIQHSASVTHCPGCNGIGYHVDGVGPTVIHHPCASCGGKGVIPKDVSNEQNGNT